jgi:hypothetical protein
MRDRLGKRQLLERQAARLLPKRNRLLGLLRLAVVMRQQFGLGVRDIGGPLPDYPGDLAVQFLPPPFK